MCTFQQSKDTNFTYFYSTPSTHSLIPPNEPLLALEKSYLRQNDYIKHLYEKPETPLIYFSVTKTINTFFLLFYYFAP